MVLTEIYVNDHEVAGEYIAQAFFEWNGQEWEMTNQSANAGRSRGPGPFPGRGLSGRLGRRPDRGQRQVWRLSFLNNTILKGAFIK
jgi:hypothetical protein